MCLMHDWAFQLFNKRRDLFISIKQVFDNNQLVIIQIELFVVRRVSTLILMNKLYIEKKVDMWRSHDF